ncbi:hypothetical protein V6L77_00975 [Pannonibacter sp. Pt2-lr]
MVAEVAGRTLEPETGPEAEPEAPAGNWPEAETEPETAPVPASEPASVPEAFTPPPEPATPETVPALPRLEPGSWPGIRKSVAEPEGTPAPEDWPTCPAFWRMDTLSTCPVKLPLKLPPAAMMAGTEPIVAEEAVVTGCDSPRYFPLLYSMLTEVTSVR